MPSPRRSLASPVVSGVLCPCGSPRPAATSPSPEAGAASPSGRSLGGGPEHLRLRTLFQKLDVNRDGALCVHDLAVGLGQLGLHRTERDLWTPCNTLADSQRSVDHRVGVSFRKGTFAAETKAN